MCGLVTAVNVKSKALWVSLDQASSESPGGPVFGLAAQHRSWVRLKASGSREHRPGQARDKDQSSITACSRTDSPDRRTDNPGSRTDRPGSSTWTNPWLWGESGPGPHRRGSRRDDNHPGAAACLDQGGPEDRDST